MSEPVRIGIFQITSHPAVVVGDQDYLAEPFAESGLTRVARGNVELRECQVQVKKRYLEWASTRLTELLEWLSEIILVTYDEHHAGRFSASWPAATLWRKGPNCQTRRGDS